MEKNVCSLVVTYNRKEKLRHNIECLMAQSYKPTNILIIDNNSNDGTYEYIEDLVKSNDTIISRRMKDNHGGSGGFFNGIKIAIEECNADYIWGMDDDAFPEIDALENIMHYVKIDDECCYWSNCNKDEKEYDCNGLKNVDSWMFVGFFISKKIIDKVGYPRGDFFIYFDDVEFSTRIIEAGFRIKKVKNSIINHKDSPGNLIKKKILFINLETLDLPDWKLYYYVRNDILRFKWNNISKYRRVFLSYPHVGFCLLFLKPRQFKVFLKAYFSGLFGLAGKKMTP